MRNTITYKIVWACAFLISESTWSQTPAVAESLIHQQALSAHMEFLSHDFLEGRGVGSRGDALTRLYIRTQLAALGLEPAGENGSWEQPVAILGIRSDVKTPLTARGSDGGTLTFEAPNDYVARAGIPEPSTAWDQLPLVFVGYGIHAPEQSWDDFKDTDVRGKVLLVMNNDPEDDPNLFAGKTRLYYGRWTYKYEEAARRGAAGVLIIHTTPSAGYPFQVIQAGQGQEQFDPAFDPDQPHLNIQAWCSEEAAQKMAKLGGHDLAALVASAQSSSFRPVDLGVTVGLGLENTCRTLESANVVGRLPGRDPELASEAVVLTAHFDHLGVGRIIQGDAIYNGALDNASGTAALLTLARAAASLPERPRRSLVFCAVTAEESGLIGSWVYAQNPTVPRKKIIANFNIDGINIWGPTRDIGMIGHGKNSLTQVAEAVCARRERLLVPDPEVDKGLFYRSDHFSFARVGIPSAYFKAGNQFLEREEGLRRAKLTYTATRYHQPSDEFRSDWNLAGAVDDTRLIFECLLRVAEDPKPPTWTPGDEFEKLR